MEGNAAISFFLILSLDHWKSLHYIRTQGGATGTLADGTDITAVNCCCTRDLGATLLSPEETQDLLFLRSTLLGVVQTVAADASNGIASDPKRTYVTGHSNGCVAALSLAATSSDIVAGAACHAGAMVTPLAADYTPVPVWYVYRWGVCVACVATTIKRKENPPRSLCLC